MTRNYEDKLSASELSGEIITGNYQMVYYVALKCVNYRDTGVSRNVQRVLLIQALSTHKDILHS